MTETPSPLKPTGKRQSSEPAQPSSRRRWVVVLLLVIAAGAAFWKYGDYLSLEQLAQHEQRLRSLEKSQPALVYGGAFLIYVLVTGCSLPGATIMSLGYAWYFGFWRALILISFASTTGATMAFLMSRWLFRDWVERAFSERLAWFNDSVEREGAMFLFSLRLIPVVPFFMINVMMGLTAMRTRTFWWVSQVGMAAGTVAYVYAGSRVPGLTELAEEGLGAVFEPSQITQLFVAMAALGLLPFAAKWLMRFLRPGAEG